MFTFKRISFVIVTFLVSVFFIACSGESDTPPSPTPPGQVEPSPTPPPRQGPQTDGPTGPGPQPGRPCPVERDICDFAVRLLDLTSSGNLDGLVALTDPVPATCPAAGLGGPSAALCAGAAPGEMRRGYWDFQAGEGLVVTEAEWRRTIGRWLASIRGAQGSDVYGPGGLRIGGVSCPRDTTQPAGVCSPAGIRVNLTFINPPTLDPSMGTGLPGQRTSFSFTLHRTAAGLKVEGFGTIVPPNTVLLAWSVDAVEANGKAMIIEYYPWTP
jgi:hypothetical protein